MAINKELDDDFDDRPDTAADSVPPVYNINNNFWATIEKSVPKNTSKLMKFITNYRNKYIDILETPYPTDYPVWPASCDKIIFETLGIDEDDLYEFTKNVEGVGGYLDVYGTRGSNKQTVNTRLYAQWLLIRYYTLHKMTKELTIMKYFVGYYAWQAAFTKRFKYKPNPDIMKHTINRMSNRSKIKKLGSVNKLIYYGVDAHCESYKAKIERGADFDYLYVLNKLRDRFAGYINNIGNEFKKDYDNKSYIWDSKVQADDGSSMENPSKTADIITLAEKHTANFFQHPISEKCIKYAVNKANKGGWIPEKDLRNTIFMIADNPDNQDDVRSFFQAMFYIFLNLPDRNYTPKNVHSRDFIVDMQRAYKPGNSNDENRIIVHELIDKWLKVGSATYRATNRKATQSVFRRSIFDYFIYKIATD